MSSRAKPRSWGLGLCRSLGLSLSFGLSAMGCSGEGCGTRGANPNPISASELPARSTVYLVRALPTESGEDGPLSRLSQVTALGLPQELDLESLEAVYVSDGGRAKETASVVAMVKGIEPTVIDTGDRAKIRELLDAHKGGHMLIVGPARDLVGVAEVAGYKRALRIGKSDYGELIVIRIDGTKTKIKRKPFGKKLRKKVDDGEFGPPRQESSGGTEGDGSAGTSSAGESSTAR